MAHGPIKIRDDSGLDLVQRRLLSEIVLTGSWEQAAKNCGIDRRTVRRMFKEPAFKEAYDELYDVEEIRATERELNLVSDDVAKIFEEAKDAELTKQVQVTCPSCKHRFNWQVKVIDFATKLRAGEILMKYRGYLKDQRSVKVEGSVQVEHVVWDMRDYMVMERLKLGLPVPEQAYLAYADKAKKAGITPPPMPKQLIEGEVISAKNHSDEQ